MHSIPQSAPDQLAELKQQFDACSLQARNLMESLPEAELQKRPANGGWSVAENIQHLTITNDFYIPILADALPVAPEGKGLYKMDWKGRLLKWILEPPYRSKAKTIPSMEPKIGNIHSVLPDFLASQQRFLDAMAQWQGRALNKVLISSPFKKSLRYNIYSLFNVVAAHQRRHLWQAQRVKEEIKGR